MVDPAPSQSLVVTASEAPAPSPLTVEAFGLAIGSELGGPLGDVRAVLESYAASRELSLDQAQKLLAALQSAERLARRCTTIARLPALTEVPQKKLLHLDEGVQAVLQAYDGLFEQLGLQVRVTTKPLLVICNPELLQDLTVAMVEWAIDNGRRIGVMARPAAERPNPVQPYLQITVYKESPSEGATPVASRAMDDSLSWRLIAELAARMELPAVRTETDAHYRIQIPFPKPPEDLEALAEFEDASTKPWWEE